MFGGGNGSFGVAQSPNPFGGSAQASPVNPFQGGGGGFGGAANGAGFGNEGTSFGGRGGRNSFSSRGGRTPSRGGGRSGGRNGAPYQGNTFGTPGGSFSGGGRGRGAGPVVSSTSGGLDNPFGSPGPSPGGFGAQPAPPSAATSFGRGGGRNGGRNGGRDGAGRGTTFGGGAIVQPNIRRKSDAGGRGSRTTFGQAAAGGTFVPPLPPSSPPPMGSARKPGRGGIVTQGAAAVPPSASGTVTTAFGQPNVVRPKGRIVPASSAPQDAANPFAGSAPSEPTRTAFGAPDAFQDGFQEPSAFEARFNGSKMRSNQRIQSSNNQQEGSTTFGRQARNKPVGNGASGFQSFPAVGQEGSDSVSLPMVKSKKKMGRSTPQSSPPPTPAPASSTPGHGDYQVIGDQKNKAELASAENLDGTCVDMCSPAERELHIRVDELSLFEKCFPGQPGQESELIVKRFQRSSADHKLDIPSELRPLGVLRRTQLYLEQQIMDRERLGPDPRFSTPREPELIELYNFCWDRCRMIRKDFVLQNYRGAGGRVHPIVVDVHERIARYHILSEHELCEVPSFVAQQNMEQLGQTLKSLNELYDESRKLNDPANLSPFEAEFRGYFILCTLDNGRGSDVLKFVKGLAPQVREAPQVKFAMQVFVARHTQNYYMFFNLLRQATYLQACLVFRYIPSMRSLALERLNRANRQPYPLGDLVDLLCFDDFEHAESVCAHHGLDVASAEESAGDGEPVVNFGGEFETDIQLRQNKNPLPVRASHVYISQKQGDFLRGDVCRGVTEYAQEDYPPLSMLIEDTENAERMALYPDRQPYEDEYSAFAVYTADPYEQSSQTRSAHSFEQARSSSAAHHPRSMSSTDPDENQHELDEIARKKAEVERAKIKMLERIQQLEREKEEKKRKAMDTEAVAREASRREAEEKARLAAEATRKEREAEEKKQAEEEARKRRQLQLEAEERQRAEAAKAAAEQARLAELRRIAEEKRQAEEERVRLELQKAEEERRRKAAAAAELRRQQELAAEQERLAQEAKRQAELALEAARRKRLQRLEKQRLAVLRLRFHVWKKYVAGSKALPVDVSVKATALVERRPVKDNKAMEWLFGGPRAVSDFIGLQRRQLHPQVSRHDYSPPLKGFWEPLDVATVIGQALLQAGRRVPGWKFVVADLLDDGLSSFGSWCAVKSGISSGSFDEEETFSTLHSTLWSEASSLAVCCRYLSANFLRNLSAKGREKKLAGTSAVIMPLDLMHTLDRVKLQVWEERVQGVLAHLHPSRQVGIVVLGFCASGVTRRGDALAAAEASIQRILHKYQEKISFIDGDLILEEDLASSEGVNEKLSRIFAKLAATKSPLPGRHVVDLTELISTVADEALQERSEVTESVTEVQEHLHKKLWNLRDALLSPSVIDIDIPVPELQGAVGAPLYGWNSREAQQRWDALFKVLTSHKLAASSAPVASLKVCEVYFEQICQLVDAIFSQSIYQSVISTSELKLSLFSLLVPIHDEFSRHSDSMIHDASTLLPWRQIFGLIYGAFIECIQEELLYIPTKLVESLTRRSDVGRPLSVVGGMAKRSKSRATLDASAQASAVAFARRELKRALNDQSTPPPQVNGIKRLRQEVSRDRAAAQSYQQFLRRELDRWATADEALH